MRTARRYSATPEDAEDAYQRGLEILLTKAPTTSEEELVPWLKTVVKHEAFAIRRQRDRATPTSDGEALVDPSAAEPPTDERAEGYERLRLGAEALRHLKPQEVRCLVLRAEGYSYKQICEETGWTYTKVNRCLTEGRQSFLAQVAGIEAGEECDRLSPLLSALADGEAKADDLKALRPHLKSCLACRARLREFRSVPKRVAALLPPAVLALPAAAASSPLGQVVDALTGGVQDRAAALSERVHHAAEVASAQKAAAVAASAAALAGGGAVTVREIDADERAAAHKPTAKAEKRQGRPAALPAPPRREPEPPAISAKPPQSAPGPSAAAAAPPRSQPQPPPAQAEFSPGAAPSSSAPPPSDGGGGEFSGDGGGSAPSGAAPPSGGGAEFGP